jgi:hypothetical protein
MPQRAPDVRYVVMHRPGPAWQAGVDFREQPGVEAHRDHYAAMYARRQLEMGGAGCCGSRSGHGTWR